MNYVAILKFKNEDDEVELQLGPAEEETVRKEAREEVKVYTAGGYKLVTYILTEVQEND